MNAGAPRDVVIAGGGLAGTLAGFALARSGFSVTMIEAAAPAQRAPDGRSLSLSLASVRILESLGLWAALAAAARPITTVHISQAGRFGALRLSAREFGVAALGQVLPAQELLAAIETAAEAAGVEHRFRAQVVAAEPGGDGLRAVELRAEPGGSSILSARLLVVASGAGSPLAAALGMGAREHDYGASALVTTVAVTHPQPGVAFERFTREGTLALLPRRGSDMGVVWTLDDARAKEFAALGPDAFADRVASALGGRLGRLAPRAALRTYPLKDVRSFVQTAPRAVLLGNAAHALHPIAAQGFNLTVRDIAVLVESAAAGGDPGAPAVLSDYAGARRRDQARTFAFTGAARRLGELSLPGAASARAAGLLAFELLRPFAREMTRQGAGLASRPLPALARGASL